MVLCSCRDHWEGHRQVDGLLSRLGLENLGLAGLGYGALHSIVSTIH
jgi:hypothetical protein